MPTRDRAMSRIVPDPRPLSRTASGSRTSAAVASALARSCADHGLVRDRYSVTSAMRAISQRSARHRLRRVVSTCCAACCRGQLAEVMLTQDDDRSGTENAQLAVYVTRFPLSRPAASVSTPAAPCRGRSSCRPALRGGAVSSSTSNAPRPSAAGVPAPCSDLCPALSKLLRLTETLT